MEKLKMQTANVADENFKKLAALFPNAVTETVDANGNIVRAIDKDILMQEINTHVVEGREERYQFSWPDKRKSILAANAPSTNTLRPCREDSVNFETTNNLYIEGDNLEVLKLLQENYLGKVNVIYIDPPYNTGNDFVYNDNYAQTIKEYTANSGQIDEDGNRITLNPESNGRFHTDWLNMMYPRLKVCRNLLSEDGMIFISIGDEELDNLKKICDEIFGPDNFRNLIAVRRGAKSVQAQFETWDKLGKDYESILMYTKDPNYRFPQQTKLLDEVRPGSWNNHWRGTDRPTMRYELFGITPASGQWRWSKERSEKGIENYCRMLAEIGTDAPSQSQIDKWYEKQPKGTDLLRLSTNGKPEHFIPSTNTTLLNSSWMDLLVGSSSEILKLFDTKVFDTAKLTSVIKRIVGFADKNAIVLDFFSGSATTAHAVMQMNVDDKGSRKFIMVQLPDKTDPNSDPYKAGYYNICEIGKERIRRAAKKIKEEAGSMADGVDLGFRVLKLDSSNMEDVYYTPEKHVQDPSFFGSLFGNIKEGRTGEDLLFQAMLELDVELSSKIETTTIDSKTVYNVADNYLLACFDENVTDKTIEEIAKLQPSYFVMRDSSMANDSVAVNFEQLFKSYSPSTILKVF